jgi:hypothetical protein
MAGGCAAFVGWVFGRLPQVDNSVAEAAVRGMFLGMLVAAGVGLVDALWGYSLRQFFSVLVRVAVALLVGGVGGFLGGAVGQLLYNWTDLALFLVLGWTVTGFLIGASPGLFDLVGRTLLNEDVRGAARKVRNGVLGGTVGGLLGGGLYLLLGAAWARAFRGDTESLWSPSAWGFVALGLCIGLLIGLAQIILMEAWVKIESGRRAGKEVILSRSAITIGRAESCDLGLFGDMTVAKLHARIVRQGNQYLLEDAESPSGTYLNGEQIKRPTPLRSGDVIQIGQVSLRFGERQQRPARAV